MLSLKVNASVRPLSYRTLSPIVLRGFPFVTLSRANTSKSQSLCFCSTASTWELPVSLDWMELFRRPRFARFPVPAPVWAEPPRCSSRRL